MDNMKRLEGVKADYTQHPGAAGGIYLSGNGVFVPVAPGQEVHFERDDSDYRLVNSVLVRIDGSGSVAPDPRVAVLEAKLAELKARLQAIAAGL